MERLTNRNYGEISHTGRIIPYSTHCIGCIAKDCDCGIVEDMVKKLADYEDLEEQGRLIKLPCKVGDDVYYILGIPNETPCVIDKCTFELSDINKIGKTLFLTKSEAEAKLKGLRGRENESSN